MVERVEPSTTTTTKTTMVKPRVGVLLRDIRGEKSAIVNTELEELTERYKQMLPQFKKLERALQQRHTTMIKSEEARTGVAQVLAELSAGTPLEDAAGRPQERSTADNGYANATDEWAKQNQRHSEKFKTFALDYVEQWESTVAKRVNTDLQECNFLRREADHYQTKVEGLEANIQKLEDKGKPAPDATTEKLHRNREKLDEATDVYNRAAKDLFLLMEEVVDRSWRDLQPLLVKLCEFDLDVHGEEEQVMRTVQACLSDLDAVGQENDIDKTRLDDLAEEDPETLTTRPNGTADLDEMFAVSNAAGAASGRSSSSQRKDKPEQARFNRSNNNNDNKPPKENTSNRPWARSKDKDKDTSSDSNNNSNNKPMPWARNKNKDKDDSEPKKESSMPWGNKNKDKPAIKRNDEGKASKSAANNHVGGDGGGGRQPYQSQGHHSTTAGTANQAEAEDPYADADPDCWRLKEMPFNGSAVCVEMGEKEEVKGRSIEEGVERFKANPGKYIAMMYQSNMLDWPENNHVYSLVHRKGTVGYEPKGIGPKGHLTLLLWEYQRLPPFKDHVLPKAYRDKYTDTMLSKFNGKKLHTNTKPLLPGRGMGVCDMPNLKIIGDVDPSDIAQGSVGNCWLLSGISALAEFDGAVKHLFRKTKNLDDMPRNVKNGCNMYTITLWDLQKWKEVDIVIDERLCADANGQLLASKPSEDGELWVPYLEKALAAHCGGWDKIVGGQCTHAWALMTGCKEQYTIRRNKETGKFQCFSKYNPYDKSWAQHANSPHDGCKNMWRSPWPKVGGGGDEKLELDEEELFQRMCAWDDVNYIVGASTDGVSSKKADGGLVDDHAYSVLESINDVAGTEIDLIKVRNPWGNGEIEDGMFDDDGPGWDRYPQIKKALNPVVADDGIFWVTKQEFFRFYGTIYLSASNMTEFLED